MSGQGLGTGGLVGNNGAGGSIAQSYATGAVSGQGAALGGLVGRNDGTTTLSYWNTQTSGMADGAGAGSVTGVTGLDSAGMRDASSFTGFDRMVWAPADGTDAPLLYGVSGVVGVVQSAVYGDDPQTVPLSLLGGWAWSRVTGLVSSTLAAGTNVGTYLNFLDTSGVSATFSAGGAARVVNVGAVVTPATLTVTAANGTMVYGDAVPSLGYTTSGWKNGQSDALLSGVTVSTSATALSDVGDYASTATGGVLSGAALGNYTIFHTTGTVSITPATLTVTAANGTMVYGDAVPSLGYSVSGWKNGQGDALLSGVGVSTSATSLSSVGRYVSTAMGGVLSGDAAGNYTLRYVDGHLVIVQPPPVVVVDDPSRPAGTANPPSTDRPTASDPRATPGVPVELPPPSGIAAFLPARFIDPVAPSPAAPPVAGRSGSEAGSPGLASEQDGGGDGPQDACGAAGGEGCASLPHPANRVLGTFLSVKSP